MDGIQIPGREEFLKKIELFERNEKRGEVYFEALNYILRTWSNPDEMAKGIRILLHGWHWNFYRFGDFDAGELKDCIERNLGTITEFKHRDISSLSQDDENRIKELFNQFLDALRGGNRKSPVAVSKALNLNLNK